MCRCMCVHALGAQWACALLAEEDVAPQVVRALGLQLLQGGAAASLVELLHEDQRHSRVGVDGGLSG